MSPKQRSDVGIFFDHLYFSAFCVLVFFLLVYGIARWAGHGFDLDDYIVLCVVVGSALSLILAAYLTHKQITRRSSDFIARTYVEK